MTTLTFAIFDLASTQKAVLRPLSARWASNVKDPSGVFSFRVPIGSVPSELVTGQRDVLIARDGQWFWRGQVLGRRFSQEGAAQTVDFFAVGLFELLADRYIPKGSSYTDLSASIPGLILADIQAQSNGAIVQGQTIVDNFSQAPTFPYNDKIITKRYDAPTSAKEAILDIAQVYPIEFFMHPVPTNSWGIVGPLATPSSTPTLLILPGGYYVDPGTAIKTYTEGVQITSIEGTDNLAPGGAFTNYVEAYGRRGVPMTELDTALISAYRRRDRIDWSSDDENADTLTGRATTILFDGKPRTIPKVRLRAGEDHVILGTAIYVQSRTFPDVNGKWRVIANDVEWLNDDLEAFTQTLTLEPFSLRNFDPWA